MEHDHQSSKAEGKAAGTRGRKNATSYLSSDARGVLDLQQAAGNRAVAKMLSGSTSPVSVQRLPVKFDDALDSVVTDQSKFEVKDFAGALVKVAEGAAEGGADKKAKGVSGGIKKSSKAPTKESIKERVDALAKAGTPEARSEARTLRKQDAQLKRLEKIQENKETLLEKFPDLKVDDLGESELQTRVDDLEQQQSDEEERAKYMKKIRRPQMNAGSISSLRRLL